MFQTPPFVFPEATADDLVHLAQPYLADISEAVRKRIVIERAVVRRAIECLLAHGYMLRAHDGEEFSSKHTRNVETVMAGLFDTDEANIFVYRQAGPAEAWHRFGSVYLVYGNDGWDVIADHSMSVADALAPVSRYADLIADVIEGPVTRMGDLDPYPVPPFTLQPMV